MFVVYSMVMVSNKEYKPIFLFAKFEALRLNCLLHSAHTLFLCKYLSESWFLISVCTKHTNCTTNYCSNVARIANFVKTERSYWRLDVSLLKLKYFELRKQNIFGIKLFATNPLIQHYLHQICSFFVFVSIFIIFLVIGKYLFIYLY